MAIQVGDTLPYFRQNSNPPSPTSKQTLIISGFRDWHLGVILLELFPGKFEHGDKVSDASIQAGPPFAMGKDGVLSSRTSGPGGVLPRLQSEEAASGALG